MSGQTKVTYKKCSAPGPTRSTLAVIYFLQLFILVQCCAYSWSSINTKLNTYLWNRSLSMAVTIVDFTQDSQARS